MSHTARKPILLFAAGLFALSAAACQTTLTLDDARLEQVITDQFKTQTGVTLTAVDCPDDRPLQQGDTFNCTATTELDEALTIEVTQTDDTGNVSWKTV